MKILAFDTSGMFLCLGVSVEGKRREYKIELGRKLSVLLAPSIQRVLQSLDLEPCGLDHVAVGTGPGSFTSLRVGIASAKGIAWSCGKKVIGVPSLDILAHNAPPEARGVIAAMDAKRGMIYCGVYRNSRGRLRRVSPHMLVESRLAAGRLNRYLPRSGETVICGDGISVLEPQALTLLGARPLDRDHWYPQPDALLKLAEHMAGRGQAVEASRVEPIYLYPKECQIRKPAS